MLELAAPTGGIYGLWQEPVPMIVKRSKSPIYLGYKYWTAPVATTGDVGGSFGRGFLSQLVLIIGNPKVLVMFVVLLPTVIDVKDVNIVGYGELCICTIVLIPGIELAYVIVAARALSALAGATARKRINKGAVLS